ncbi:aspartic proteinase Asp1-like [Phragmites australis]|uniref:aspartic proteinase Asp1-like n=1 Tax=Phragmites australis TaxID=29695 RepID=UPI002D7A346F|nr:aspartic proteinase Asp1-like [Phragmites australis]
MAARWGPPAGLVLLLLALALAPAVQADKPARGGPTGEEPEASSAVFQLYGDVYPHGLYYVAMSIGNPARPYFLDVDTGSDLTWLQCDAPCVSCSKVPHPLYRPTKNKLVPCVDQLCASLHGGLTEKHKCDSAHQQCDYEIRYADQGSSIGVLVNDNFTLRLTNTSVVCPSLAFGCGYDQQVGSSSEVAPTDGVLGLGSGSISLLSQLKQHGITKNVVGHCLSLRGGGFLFFGDDLVPYSHVMWVPMARSASRNYYSPGSASLYFGGRSLGVRPIEVVLDSGSSFTYFATQPYQALVTALKGNLSKTLQEVSDPSLPLCWKGKKPFKSVLDVKKEFKSLVLSFSSGKKALMEIPPENYLIVTKYGNACLGILNGSEVGLKDLNILGDITMQDQMVIYDNEKGQIGWIRAPCDRIPNDNTIHGFEEGYCWPQFPGIVGLQNEDCPAYYRSNKERLAREGH